MRGRYWWVNAENLCRKHSSTKFANWFSYLTFSSQLLVRPCQLRMSGSYQQPPVNIRPLWKLFFNKVKISVKFGQARIIIINHHHPRRMGEKHKSQQNKPENWRFITGRLRVCFDKFDVVIAPLRSNKYKFSHRRRRKKYSACCRSCYML